uniref:NHP2 ribonucleoprotein homolog (yeast) n=1 Tax=Neogobius melanostomus TaxID=47308 RepID=A0A8C6UBG2_9GOBI
VGSLSRNERLKKLGITDFDYSDVGTYLNIVSPNIAAKIIWDCLNLTVFSSAASKVKQIRRGVKEVQKFINKGEKGIVVLAGDTLPIDVYCHLPVMCEDRSLPYAYIPSKLDLGSSAGSKRPTCVILIKPHEDYQEQYDEVLEEVSTLPKPL